MRTGQTKTENKIELMSYQLNLPVYGIYVTVHISRDKKTNQINTESNVCIAVPNSFSLAVSVYLIDRQSKSVATNEFNERNVFDERNVSIRINGKMYSKKSGCFCNDMR